MNCQCALCGADADGTLEEEDSGDKVCRNCYEVLSKGGAVYSSVWIPRSGVHQADKEDINVPVDIVY
jgi:hypothetical protein